MKRSIVEEEKTRIQTEANSAWLQKQRWMSGRDALGWKIERWLKLLGLDGKYEKNQHGRSDVRFHVKAFEKDVEVLIGLWWDDTFTTQRASLLACTGKGEWIPVPVDKRSEFLAEVARQAQIIVAGCAHGHHLDEAYMVRTEIIPPRKVS